MALISQGYHRARKEYDCAAAHWLRAAELEKGELTFSELRAIAEAKANHWRILKGQYYLRQFIVDEFPFSFIALPALHEICLKYKIYGQ